MEVSPWLVDGFVGVRPRGRGRWRRCAARRRGAGRDGAVGVGGVPAGEHGECVGQRADDGLRRHRRARHPLLKAHRLGAKVAVASGDGGDEQLEVEGEAGLAHAGQQVGHHVAADQLAAGLGVVDAEREQRADDRGEAERHELAERGRGGLGVGVLLVGEDDVVAAAAGDADVLDEVSGIDVAVGVDEAEPGAAGPGEPGVDGAALAPVGGQDDDLHLGGECPRGSSRCRRWSRRRRR